MNNPIFSISVYLFSAALLSAGNTYFSSSFAINSSEADALLWPETAMHSLADEASNQTVKTLLQAAEGESGRVVEVSDTPSLEQAAATATAGTTILLNDGVYQDIKLIVTAHGTADKKVLLKAKHSGKVSFCGDVKVELRGDYNVLSGIYFHRGARNPKAWKSHGPGLVAIYADHCEVSDCLFYHFDTANSAYITTSLTADGHVPQYAHIHHCAFIEKTTLDQVINLNNTPKKSLQGEPGKPMYHRISYCYFSNPPKKGNAGGGIRVGYWRKDYGRCLIDHNLFERQDSEPEIVTSKSMENVYYANTFLNCQGTLNFRHGDHQVALNNIFLGTDQLHEYGAIFVWGSDHLIGNNYISLSRTLTKRGGAAISFNCGPKGSEHALAYRSVIVNNVFYDVNGVAFHFAPLYDRRLEVFGSRLELPHDLQFVNNYVSSSRPRKDIWKDVQGNASRQHWQGNQYKGYTSRALRRTAGWVPGEAPQPLDAAALQQLLPYTSIPGIDLNFLEILSHPIQTPSCNVRPLQRHDVGPSWCTHYPGTYFDTGVFPN